MKTFQIQLQIKTIFLNLAVLLLLLGMVEIIFRMDGISSRLAVPSFGSDHHEFEIQLSRLKSYHQKHGSIECIFVGDSLVWLDMDPLRFSEGYHDQTGKELACFNFGIAGLPASGVSVLTEILVQEYNPKLIIYGLHANSLVVGRDSEDTKIVIDTPWVRYKTGDFNVLGMLYEESYFVRYLQVSNRLMQFDREALENENGREPAQLLGFDPKSGQRIDPEIPPSRSNEADVKGFEKYFQYHIFPENILGLQNLAQLTDPDTRVIMVMMPVHNSFYAFFEYGEQDYLDIVNTIRAALTDTNTALVETGERVHLPDETWWDYSHLNRVGAEEFSYWLGEEIGNQLSAP